MAKRKSKLPDWTYKDFIHPWPTMREREWIREQSEAIAERFEKPVIVHIGVELGISLYASHAGAPDARLVGIDLDLANWTPGIKAELIQEDSANAFQDFDGPVHFLFVDGDHEEAGVKADIEGWLPKVPVGGVVAFHDYWNQKLLWCLGVSKAVDAYDWAHWQEIPATDSIRAFQRVEDDGTETG